MTTIRSARSLKAHLSGRTGVRRPIRAQLERSDAPSSSRLQRFGSLREQVKGWMHDGAEVVWDAFLSHQRALGERGHFLEFGVFHGLSAALMALHADPAYEELVLVDKVLRTDSVERSLRLAGWDPARRTHLLQTTTASLAGDRLPLFGQPFRWIHIDAEHTAHAVRRELALVHQLLSPNGVVVVDDFFGDHYPQVTAAVYGYLATHPTHFRLFASGFGKAYLVRKASEGTWLDYCRDQLPHALESRGLSMTIWKTSDEPESSYGIRYREGNDGPVRGHNR